MTEMVNVGSFYIIRLRKRKPTPSIIRFYSPQMFCISVLYSFSLCVINVVKAI